MELVLTVAKAWVELIIATHLLVVMSAKMDISHHATAQDMQLWISKEFMAAVYGKVE